MLNYEFKEEDDVFKKDTVPKYSVPKAKDNGKPCLKRMFDEESDWRLC